MQREFSNFVSSMERSSWLRGGLLEGCDDFLLSDEGSAFDICEVSDAPQRPEPQLLNKNLCVTNSRFEYQISSMLEQLNVLRDKIVSETKLEVSLDGTVDYVTSLQLIGLLVTSTYVSAANCIVRQSDMCGWTGPLEKSLQSAYCSSFTLMEAIVAALEGRVGRVKCAAIEDYVRGFLAVVRRACDAIPSWCSEILQGSRYELSVALLRLAKAYRDLSLFPATDKQEETVFHQSSSQSQSQRQQSKKRVRSELEREDDDDDFMDASSDTASIDVSNTKYAKQSSSSNLGIRLNFGIEELSLFATIVQASFALAPNSQTAERILLLLQKADEGALAEKIVTPDKVFLFLGEKLAGIASEETLFSFVASNNWDKRLGILGYSRILYIFHCMLRRPEFGRNLEKEGVFMNDVLEIVFGTNPIFKSLPQTYWRARSMRIICGGLLLNADITLCKNLFAECVISGLSDVDMRVRLVAAQHTVHLFALFKNHNKIYRSISENFTVNINAFVENNSLSNSSDSESLISASEHADDWMAFSTAKTLAMIGSSSVQVLPQAMFDLVVLCRTRYETSAQDRRRAFCVDSSRNLLNFQNILLDGVSVLCTRQGFRSMYSLATTHLRYLIFKWIQAIVLHRAPLNTDAVLLLKDFPYFIVGCYSYSDFISQFKQQLLQVICQLDSPSDRWKFLLDLSEDAGYGRQDSGVTSLLRTTIVGIKAMEIFVTNHVSIGVNTPEYCALRGADIKGFLARVITKEYEVLSHLQQYTTDLLMEIMDMICSGGIGLFELRGDCTHEQLATAMHMSLCAVAEAVGADSVAAMLKSCCLLELTASMRVILMERACTMTRVKIISCMRCFTRHANWQSKLALYAMLSLISSSMRCSPLLLLPSALLMKEFVDQLCKSVRHSSSGRDRGLEILCDLYSEALCMKCVVHRLLVPIQISDCKLLEDDFLKIHYKTYADYNTVSQELLEKDISDASHLLASCLDSIRLCFQSIAENSSVTNNNCHLFEPSQLFEKYRIDSERLSDGNCDVISLIGNLNDFCGIFLSGIPVSPCGLWLRVLAVEESLTSKFITTSSQALWQGNADLLSSCISRLVAVCRLQSETYFSMRRHIVSILGALGPPDVFTVSHSALPAPAANLGECKGDISCLKTLIVVYLCGMLCLGDATTSKAASRSLRVLHKHNCLATLASSGGNKSNSRSAKDIQEAYNCNGLHSGEVVAGTILSEFDYSQQTSASEEYDKWIRHFVSHHIQIMYFSKYREESGYVFASSDTRLLSCPESLRDAGSDLFVAWIIDAVAVSSAVAEAVFPLVFCDIIRNHTEDHGALIAYFSDSMSLHMLSTDSLPQASRLALKTISFLLRQNVISFKETSQKRSVKSTSPHDSIPPVLGLSPPWKPPFGISLNIDLQIIVNAAVRCGAICSALMLIELHMESFRSDMVEDSRREVAGLTSPEFLFSIFSEMHDPDAVVGVNHSLRLEIQANLHAHRCNWTEALSTYETLLQASAPSGLRRNYNHGIASALRGLGYQHLLEHYNAQNEQAARTSLADIEDVTSEVHWRRDPLALRADAALRSWDMESTFPNSRHEDYNPISGSRQLFTYVSEKENVSQFNFHLSDALRNMRILHPGVMSKTILSCCNVAFPALLWVSEHESAIKFVHHLAKLQQIVEMQEAFNVLIRSNANEDADDLLKRWGSRLVGAASSPVLGETFLAHRLALLRNLMSRNASTPRHSLQLMGQIIDVTRSRSLAFSCSPLAYMLKNLVCDELDATKISSYENNFQKEEWVFLECQLLWKKGMAETAISVIYSHVIKPLRDAVVKGRCQNEAQMGKIRDTLSAALRTCGEWMDSRRASTRGDILKDYFEPAVTAAHSQRERVESCSSLGDFAARMHMEIKLRMNTVEWQQRVRIAQERKLELDNCLKLFREKYSRKSQNPPPQSAVQGGIEDDLKRSLNKHLAALQKEVEIDAKERDRLEMSCHTFLVSALRQFQIVLSISPENDLDIVFRVINLWLSNSKEDDVNRIMALIVDSTPSFKFIPLTYQVMSRLGSCDAPNTRNLRTLSSQPEERVDHESVVARLIFKVCLEHPHHVLPQLYAISHEEIVGDYSGAAQYKSNISLARVQAAKSLIVELKQQRALKALIEATHILLQAYITLALSSTKKFVDIGRVTDIGFRDLLAKGSRLAFHECLKDYVGKIDAHASIPAVLTIIPKVRRDADYGDIVRISKFFPTFNITDSGISRPKIIQCEGTDGVVYKQLVKGGDDMRQDAVLQQVFIATNVLFSRDFETRRRRIHVRTYKIVPLSPQTGVLEWVENTIPFGSYLTDKDRSLGAHARYRPSDWSHALCREKLRDEKENKEAVYKDICIHFRPVFRYFFIENYPDPVSWMTCRLAYTRSVAVTSVIGYILGIGDRHAHNILVDTSTAEVIHIDFGIMFEQGKLLATAETVPFRLTRDVVDGFGISGCEGTFRRCCEEVLRVLREHSTLLLTILEVVIHDPLYKWSLSPFKARKRQSAEYDVSSHFHELSDGNQAEKVDKPNGEVAGSASRDAAERALMRIKDKLQGYDDSSGDSLSVEGQVNLLVNEAQSAKNLCMLYPGWAPWL